MSAVEKIKSEFAAKLAAAEKEDAITAVIPAGGRVHVHELYGTVASVRYGDPYTTDNRVTWAGAMAIVDALPPVECRLIKDGCTSFRTAAYVDGLPEEKKARWEEENAASPIQLNIDKGLLEIEYVGATSAGLVRVSIHMGYLPQGIGKAEAKRVKCHGGFRYEPTRFVAADGLHTVMFHGEPIAQLEGPIRWASGGPEYPNRLTCYFCDLGAGLKPADVGYAIVCHLATLAERK